MIPDGLTRRDLLDRQHDGAVRDGVPAIPRPVQRMDFGTARAGRDPAAHVATSGDGGGPRRDFRSRLDRRTRSILTGAVVAAVIVNAGAVWAYWHITDSAAGRAGAGTVVELNLHGRSDLRHPLTPGGTSDLIVTVTNDNDVAIRITSISPGTDRVVADVEHREKGCVDPDVVVVRRPVRWDVARNDVGAYTVPNGLTMAAASDPACTGAAFTVPLLVRGVAGVG